MFDPNTHTVPTPPPDLVLKRISIVSYLTFPIINGVFVITWNGSVICLTVLQRKSHAGTLYSSYQFQNICFKNKHNVYLFRRLVSITSLWLFYIDVAFTFCWCYKRLTGFYIMTFWNKRLICVVRMHFDLKMWLFHWDWVSCPGGGVPFLKGQSVYYSASISLRAKMWRKWSQPITASSSSIQHHLTHLNLMVSHFRMYWHLEYSITQPSLLCCLWALLFALFGTVTQKQGSVGSSLVQWDIITF